MTASAQILGMHPVSAIVCLGCVAFIYFMFEWLRRHPEPSGMRTSEGRYLAMWGDEDDGAADRAYEKDRERRAIDRRPPWGDSCIRCEGFGTEETETGLQTCPACEGDGLTDAARKRRRAERTAGATAEGEGPRHARA